MLSHIEFLLAVAKSLGSHDLPTKKTEVLINFVLDSLNNVLLNNTRDGKDSIDLRLRAEKCLSSLEMRWSLSTSIQVASHAV